MKLAGPSLTNDNAAAVLQQALAALATGDTEFDFAELREVDSSAVAVLVALARDAQQRGRTLALRNPPPALRSLALLYGVQALLPSGG